MNLFKKIVPDGTEKFKFKISFNSLIMLRMGIIISGLITLVGCYEVIESEFSSVEDAQELIEKGWIPDWILPSAYELKEAHNIDT